MSVAVTLACFAVVASGQGPRGRAPELPIPLPPRVNVTFEVDAQDDDLLGTLKALIAPAPPRAPSEQRVQVSTPATNAFLALTQDGQLAKVLRDVRRVRAVTFEAPQGFEALPYYEGLFERQGYRRVLFLKERVPMVLLRHKRDPFLAAVVHTGKNVTVARIAGLPDMQLLGTIVRDLFGPMVPSGGGAISSSGPR